MLPLGINSPLLCDIPSWASRPVLRARLCPGYLTHILFGQPPISLCSCQDLPTQGGCSPSRQPLCSVPVSLPQREPQDVTGGEMPCPAREGALPRGGEHSQAPSAFWWVIQSGPCPWCRGGLRKHLSLLCRCITPQLCRESEPRGGQRLGLNVSSRPGPAAVGEAGLIQGSLHPHLSLPAILQCGQMELAVY